MPNGRAAKVHHEPSILYISLPIISPERIKFLSASAGLTSTFERHLEVTAWQTDAVNTAWHLRAGFAKGLGNLSPITATARAEVDSPAASTRLSSRAIEDIVGGRHRCSFWRRTAQSSFS